MWPAYPGVSESGTSTDLVHLRARAHPGSHAGRHRHPGVGPGNEHHAANLLDTWLEQAPHEAGVSNGRSVAGERSSAFPRPLAEASNATPCLRQLASCVLFAVLGVFDESTGGDGCAGFAGPPREAS